MKKITREEWVRGVNIWTPIVTAGFLIFCLFVPAQWFAILTTKFLGSTMTEKIWWSGWQPIYRIIAVFGVITCALCIHLILLSKSTLTLRKKDISKYEIVLLCTFCIILTVINILFNRKIWSTQFHYLYFATLIIYPLITMILNKLDLEDIGAKGEKTGFYLWLSIGIGIGSGLFLMLFHFTGCGGIPYKYMVSASIINDLLIPVSSFIFFCFGYSLKLFYTKYRNLGLYFITPLIFALICSWHSYFLAIYNFGCGVLLSLCLQRTGIFLFPLLIWLLSDYIYIFAPGRSPFFTNYFILPASIILILITILVWKKEYRRIIKT